MTARDRLHALVERMLPWFDPAEKERRDARTDQIARESIAVRVHTERVRKAYRMAADKVER